MKRNFTMPPLVALIWVSLSGFATSNVMAHGYVKSPISRAAACQKLINSECGAVQYEPQSVEYTPSVELQPPWGGSTNAFPKGGPADGHIASGGIARFSGLNSAGADRWYKNVVSSDSIEFEWFYEVEHRTAYWNYYLTKKGWNPNQPLSRAAFEAKPFCSVEGNNEMAGKGTRTSVLSCKLPGDRSGYHVVLATWKVGDTDATFYQVIDLQIANAGNTAAPSTPVIAPQAKMIGTLTQVPRALKAGDTVKARAFTEYGEDASRSVSLRIADAQQGRADAWPRLLAEAINADKRVGYVAGHMNDRGEISVSGEALFVYADPNAAIGVTRIELDFAQQLPMPVVEMLDMQPSYAIDDQGGVTLNARLDVLRANVVSLRVMDSDNSRVAQKKLAVKDGASNVSIRIDNAKTGKHDLILTARGDNEQYHQRTYSFTLTGGAGQKVPVYPEGVGSYAAGTVVFVQETGRYYQAKPFPYIDWANQNNYAYRPGTGSHWHDAWTEVK